MQETKIRVLAGEPYFHIERRLYIAFTRLHFVPFIEQIITVILCENMTDSLSSNIPCSCYLYNF